MNLEDCLKLAKLDEDTKQAVRERARDDIKAGMDPQEAMRKAVAEETQVVHDDIETLRDTLSAQGHSVDVVSHTEPPAREFGDGLPGIEFSKLRNPLDKLTKDERTFALQIHELYDSAMFKVGTAHKRLQDAVQALAGVSHDSLKGRQLDMAMMLYRDLKNSDASHISPTERMPVADRVSMFRSWAASELPKLKGDAKLRLNEFLRDLDLAENLSKDQRDFVDTTMDKAFRGTTIEAQRLGKLTGLPIKDYVHRKYMARPQDPTESNVGAAGSGSPARSFSTGFMQRKYPTLLDAMMDGYQLEPGVKGITNSWKEITTDIVKIA